MSEKNPNNNTLNEFIAEMKTAIKDLKLLTEDVKELKKDIQSMKSDLGDIKTQYRDKIPTQDGFNEDQDVDSWMKARQRHAKVHQERHEWHENKWRNKYRREYSEKPFESFTRDIGDFTGKIINTIIPNVIDNISDVIDEISGCIEESLDEISPQINLRIGQPYYRRVYPSQERFHAGREDPALKDLLKYSETTRILQLLDESPKGKTDLQQALSSTTPDLLEKILKTMIELGLAIQESSGNERYLITKFGMRILYPSSQNKSTDKQVDERKDNPKP